MSDLKTVPNNARVSDFMKAISPDQKQQDAQTVLELMSAITGEQPMMWGERICFSLSSDNHDERRTLLENHLILASTRQPCLDQQLTQFYWVAFETRLRNGHWGDPTVLHDEQSFSCRAISIHHTQTSLLTILQERTCHFHYSLQQLEGTRSLRKG